MEVQSKVRDRLDAAHESSGPSLAIVEGAAGKLTAAVMKIIRRKVWPAPEIRGGGGVPVGCDL
jgi:hypothetical protein